MKKLKRISIIGGGPRGLYALEKLTEAIAKCKNMDRVSITLIEPTDQLGSSHVYNIDQPKTNWINISERALESDLQGRPKIEFGEVVIPEFPSYTEWNRAQDSISTSDIDTFPERSYIGHYLQERFKAIARTLEKAGLLTIIKDTVTSVHRLENLFKITLAENEAMDADEVLLTIGHQSTKPGEQLSKWEEHQSKYDKVHFFKHAYPINSLLQDKDIYKGQIIALRGFGLAMIDVVRALTEGLGGKFRITNNEKRTMIYEPSGNEPKAIVPFSLDGLPVAPKPLSEKIDELFSPSADEEDKVKKSIRQALTNSEEISTIEFLIEPIAEAVAASYHRLDEKAISHAMSERDLVELTRKWLMDSNTKSKLIVPEDQLPEKSMKAFVDMAVGVEKVSLDYCLGQIWRQLQPMMYKELAFSSLKGEIIAEVVKLDERLKRYSYGSPVDSIQQLLTLIEAGIIKIRLVDDPDIELTDKGWNFEEGQSTITAGIMINTVLDSPKLIDVNTPVIRGLLSDGLIQPVHEDLGVLTSRDSRVVTTDGEKINLAFTGRLAKGTLLGVDAILECFGEPIGLWADGLSNRLKLSLESIT